MDTYINEDHIQIKNFTGSNSYLNIDNNSLIEYIDDDYIENLK